MSCVQYRAERNPLTSDTSFKLRYMPKAVVGYDELSAKVSTYFPGFNSEDIRNVLRIANQEIGNFLRAGTQVTLEDAFVYRLSLQARLDSPDDPLPPTEDLVKVKISASSPFVAAVQQGMCLERLPPEEKAPVILSAEDTNLDLSDVLYGQSVLRLTGNNLSFNKKDQECGCVIEGTRNGSLAQSQFAGIRNAQVQIVPHIPPQDNPWNNEYTVAVKSRYTEHGTVRTGIYSHKLRTILSVAGLGGDPPPETGILSGNHDAALVNVIGADMSNDTRLRIQVEYNSTRDWLVFSLLDMQRGGVVGPGVTAQANGEYEVPGFAGSSVLALNIRVDGYQALKEMVRIDYDGRVADILDLEM